MRGKLKLIPLENHRLRKGSKAIWEKALCLESEGSIRTLRKKYSPPDLWWIERKDSSTPLYVSATELKTIVVEFEYNEEKKQIPLRYASWKDVVKFGEKIENKEIDFEIEKCYVEPDESIHCNRGADIDVARIIKIINTDSLASALNTPVRANEFMKDLNNLLPKKEINWEGLKKKLYDSELVTGEQTDDAKDDKDYGAYWLNDVTVEDIISWFKSNIG